MAIRSDGATRDIHCPADGRHVATVSEATAEEPSPQRSPPAVPSTTAWPDTPAPERAALLRRVADRLVAEKEDVATLEALDTGKRMVEARIDVDDIVSVFRHFADLAQADAGRMVDAGQADIVSRVCTSRSASAA